MRKSRYSEGKIIRVLQEVESGKTVEDAWLHSRLLSGNGAAHDFEDSTRQGRRNGEDVADPPPVT